MIYELTPVTTKKAWGKNVWSRFYTAIWKAVSTTTNADEMVSEYYRLLGPVPSDVVIFVKNNETNLKEILDMVSKELRMLIGRIQFARKGKKDE